MSSSFATDLSLVNLFYFNNHNNHPVDLLVGEIIIWPTNSNYPKGFLLCDGSSYSTTEYSELYAIIGTTYGSGTGTFQVPDFKDRHIRAGNVQGNNIQVGDSSGNNTITTDNLPKHSHTINSGCDFYNTDLTYVKELNLNLISQTLQYDYRLMGPAITDKYDGDRKNARADHNHTHQSVMQLSGQGLNYNNTTNARHNDLSLSINYNTDPQSNFNSTSYVPKSKKVYYLIYSGKH